MDKIRERQTQTIVVEVGWSDTNFIDGKKLPNKRAAENHVAKFFATKPQKFYTDGIMKLPEKWQKVKDNSGTYVLIYHRFSIKKNFIQTLIKNRKILFR